MMNHMLVALDGSELAERGLAEAAALARRMKKLGAHPRIFLAQALETPLLTGVVDPVRLRLELFEATATYLEHLAQPLRDAGQNVEVLAREGPAAPVLLEMIAEHKIDLVVMATHGRTGIGRWVLGSVAAAVAEQSPVPVLLVPRDHDGQLFATDGWRILLPLDGSQVAASTMMPTMQIARALGAEVRLLYVLMPAYPEQTAEHMHATEPDRRRLREAERYLEEQTALLRQHGIVARWSLAFGSPAQAIVERAHRYQSTIVVLPRRPRSGTMPWPQGSVSQRLLRSGQAAVLFVTPVVTVAASAASLAKTDQLP